MTSFLTKLLIHYKNVTLEQKVKAKTLIIINLFLIACCCIALPLSFIKNNPVLIYAVYTSGIIIFSLAIYLVYKKHFLVASNITIFIILLAMLYLCFNTPLVHYFDIYFTALAMTFALIISSLFCSSRIQLIFLLIIGSLAIIYNYIFRILNVNNYQIDGNSLTSSLVAFIFYGLIGISSIIIASNNKKLIKIAEDEAYENKERYKELQNIIIETQRGLEIGNHLIDSTDSTVRLVESIHNELTETDKEIHKLSNQIDTSYEANTKIVSATTKIQNEFQILNLFIAESSASIEEMSASISNINNISSKKIEHLAQLVTTTQKGMEKMNQALTSIETVLQSTTQIISVSKVINAISRQTSMLAMNAAIEASHAKEYGLGFSVVASEIRKLAENTNINAKSIKDTIVNISMNIEVASQSNRETGKFFSDINNEILIFSRNMEEIVLAINEISSATSNILNAISKVMNSSKNISESIEIVYSMIKESNEGITGVKNFTGNVTSTFQNMIEDFKTILGESQMVNEFGHQNISQIKTLNQKIEEINKRRL